MRIKSFFETEVERIYQQHGLPAHHYNSIRQSRKFMELHYGQEIVLREIAKAACMSSYHFIRLFQKVYGQTPRQFLKDIRIKKAKALLKQAHPITAVCYEVGYRSLPTFCRVFKAGTGLSPSAYRELHYSNRG